ncbi:response regulator transcription factor [Lactococcus lactis]|uniref:response regulator transcription factor n=1 Tax=Lactococcus lactis TaxID=1358 RepID=UPI001D1973FC|nr:response regulator transcription factor [Lactococcus lactis]MCC4119251.1 response regulator transcription factor [Lactococcus lactis]
MLKTLLIIEDNNEIQTILKKQLQRNYRTISAFSGTEGILLFDSNKVDLILLDIMLPGKEGSQVLKEIRSTSQIPVIIMSALGDKKLVTNYLINGANDYVAKPFDLEELSARIAVQLRDTKESAKNEQLQYKNITLDFKDFSISNGNKNLTLGRLEFDILKLLMSYPERIFTKENLYESVWEEKYIAGDNTINTHLSNLRKKISQLDSETSYIQTLWGLGVRLAK